MRRLMSPIKKWSPTMPRYYDCEICGFIHRWEFDDDCRADHCRFTCEQLEEKHGTFGFELLDMESRVAADMGLL